MMFDQQRDPIPGDLICDHSTQYVYTVVSVDLYDIQNYTLTDNITFLRIFDFMLIYDERVIPYKIAVSTFREYYEVLTI